MYKLSLSASDRFSLSNGLLPSKGNVVVLQLVQKFSTQIAFTETEVETWPITWEAHENGTTTYSFGINPPDLDLEIAEPLYDAIGEELKKLSDACELNMSQLSLYEKFVEPGQTVSVEEPAHLS